MQSQKWKRRRRAYYRTYGRFCAACASEHEVTCHHITYDRFGSEELTDLWGLCRKHHRLYHQDYGRCCLENLVVFLAEHQTEEARLSAKKVPIRLAP